MRKLASIVTIARLTPIKDADRLEVAEMNGKAWNVVVRKGEFQPGALAVYFEIDSALPPDDPRYAFLRDRCLRTFTSKSGQVLRQVIRIRTVKLRGVVSQGLLIPVSEFVGPRDDPRAFFTFALVSHGGSALEEADEGNLFTNEPVRRDVVDGLDVTELLGVGHFDEIAEQLRPQTVGGTSPDDFIGPFPEAFVPKSDETRIQNLAEWFETMRGVHWEVTAKDDGSSVTMFLSPIIDAKEPFGVCSRNQRLKPTNAKGVRPLPWLMADKYGVAEKLRSVYESDGVELALQGELVGPGINGDRDRYAEHEWHVFKIYDITHQRYLAPDERVSFCRAYGIPHVAVVNPDMQVFDVFRTCDDLLKFAEGRTARGNEREGLVFKSLSDTSVSFKAVSNRYLLKQEDD